MAAEYVKPSDSHLDFSSIKNGIGGACPRLQSDILDVLVLLLQFPNEDNQFQSIDNAVKAITELYLRAQPLNPYEELNSKDPEIYDAEIFLWMLWGVLLMVVKKIPYNHPKQEHLVNFLKTLRGACSLFPSPHMIIPIHYIQPYGETNSDFILVAQKASTGRPAFAAKGRLRPFHSLIMDQASISLRISKGKIPKSSASEWLSLNSFAARLEREDLIRGISLAKGRPNDTFGREDTFKDQKIANSYISVISEWIIKSLRMELYWESRYGWPLNDQPSKKMAGLLGIADEVDQQAVGEMERVEKVMRKCAMDPNTGENRDT